MTRISRRLSKRVTDLSFSAPVDRVYNPLHYARRPHEAYLDAFGGGPKEVLLLGMNPGPFGMAQTGVPFGEIAWVRDWLGIEDRVDKPADEHPKRPILGFDCRRREVSGRRLWSWAADTFKTPEAFFARFFVWNYCPLVFLEEGGRNITPDKLKAAERRPLFEASDRALIDVVEALDPAWVIGVGAFAERQAKRVLEGQDCKVGRILHPSPASPLANRGWAEQATREFEALGIALPGTK